MVEEAVGRIRARAALGAREFAVAHGIDGQPEQRLGQVRFVGQ